MSMVRRIAAAGGLRLFKGYSESEVAQMLSEFGASIVKFRRGAVVVHEGMKAESHFIVLSGTLDLFDPVENGEWIFVRALEAGELFTVSLMMQSGTDVYYPCMVSAGTDVELLKLNVEKVRARWYSPDYRVFFENFFQTYYEYIGFCRDKFAVMYRRDAEDRIYLYLRQRAASTGSSDIVVPFRTSEQMAEYLGINRASLSRSVSALVRAGKIAHPGKCRFKVLH